MDGHQHLEADMFMEVDGIYVYDQAKNSAAHDWCVASAKKALEQGANVVVSNTFVKKWEMKRYIDLGFPFRIIEAKGQWGNIHGVPKNAIEMMTRKWESLPTAWDA